MAWYVLGWHGRNMDRYTAEPDLEDVAAEFPRWSCWIGIAGLHYARRAVTSPPAVVRGEDPVDLRDQIRGWEGKHDFRA